MKEAIILAGGLGTRLRTEVPDRPKCMALVSGRPFIAYLIEYFQKNGVEKFILSLGYKHEVVVEYIRSQFPDDDIRFSIEDEPLGTGGAIKLACGMTSSTSVLVLNGDTYFRVDPLELAAFHQKKEAHCTLALKPMTEFDRYGVVVVDDDQAVCRFEEKRHYSFGLINGGVYMLQREPFLREELPRKFSFEKDYVEYFYDKRPLYGLIQEGYFVDIGIPEDYRRAQTELVQNL
jgi:D-glycero-alpha-D-manno-heptose 1-phosphate guanylyltransferase